MDKALDSERPTAKTQKEVAQDTLRRHRLWIARGRQTAGKKFATWRPQVRYRVSAKKLLRALDNQIRVGMGKSGWKVFQKQDPKDSPEWSDQNWEFWQFLMAVCDLGSDNVSAMFAFFGFAMSTSLAIVHTRATGIL